MTVPAVHLIRTTASGQRGGGHTILTHVFYRHPTPVPARGRPEVGGPTGPAWTRMTVEHHPTHPPDPLHRSGSGRFRRPS